ESHRHIRSKSTLGRIERNAQAATKRPDNMSCLKWYASASRDSPHAARVQSRIFATDTAQRNCHQRNVNVSGTIVRELSLSGNGLRTCWYSACVSIWSSMEQGL